MGQATTLLLRERIVEMRNQGDTLSSISQQLSIPYSTVKHLCRRFRDRGSAGLVPNYANCGPQNLRYDVTHREQLLYNRVIHPAWGAPRIRVELQRTVPSYMEGADSMTKLPSVRTLQRWLRKSEAYRPRRQGAEPTIGRATPPHNIWEVDAKENLILGDGSPACYLTIADEKSGAWLEARVFPL